MTDTGSVKGNDPGQTSRTAAGHRLQRKYQALFPRHLATIVSDSADVWRAAVTHGATLEWAIRTAGTTASDTAVSQPAAFRVRWALLLAAAVPVDLIDGLLGDGWVLTELASLLHTLPDGGFPETARRLSALCKAAPGIGGPDGDLMWHAAAAVAAAGPAELTDLQALRWIQVIDSGKANWASGFVAWRDPGCRATWLQRWVRGAGPDGWVWAGAGYTPDEARVLRALSVGHPDRPGPEQLAVMAALRQT